MTRVGRRARRALRQVVEGDVYETADGGFYALPADGGSPMRVDVNPALAAGLVTAGPWDDTYRRHYEATAAGRDVYEEAA